MLVCLFADALCFASAPVRQRDRSGAEPIHLAAANGNVACLEVSKVFFLSRVLFFALRS